MLRRDDDIVAMCSDSVPGEQLDQFCCAARFDIWGDAGEMRDVSQKCFGRAKSFAKLVHTAIVIALGKATPVGSDEQWHVSIVRMGISQQML